jgi:hypothetical protein
MPAAPHPNNFLAAEPEIVAQLKAALKGLRQEVHVLTSTDLLGVQEATQPTPALHVLWRGFGVQESRADGAAARLQHTWVVVVAVRNVSTLGTGAAARAEAGELLARAGAALMGFRPKAKGVAGPMKLTNAPPPKPALNGGVLYLPLAFHLDTNFQR